MPYATPRTSTIHVRKSHASGIGEGGMRGGRAAEPQEIYEKSEKGLPPGYIVKNGKIVKEDGSGRQNKMLIDKGKDGGKHAELTGK